MIEDRVENLKKQGAVKALRDDVHAQLFAICQILNGDIVENGSFSNLERKTEETGLFIHRIQANLEALRGLGESDT